MKPAGQRWQLLAGAQVVGVRSPLMAPLRSPLTAPLSRPGDPPARTAALAGSGGATGPHAWQGSGRGMVPPPPPSLLPPRNCPLGPHPQPPSAGSPLQNPPRCNSHPRHPPPRAQGAPPPLLRRHRHQSRCKPPQLLSAQAARKRMQPLGQIQIRIRIQPLSTHWPPTSQRVYHWSILNQAHLSWNSWAPPTLLLTVPLLLQRLPQIQIQIQLMLPGWWRALAALAHSLQLQSQQPQRPVSAAAAAWPASSQGGPPPRPSPPPGVRPGAPLRWSRRGTICCRGGDAQRPLQQPAG